MPLRRRRRSDPGLPLSPLLLAVALPASAHPIGFSTLYAEVDGTRIEASWDLHPQTLVDVLPALDLDHDRELSEAEATAGREAIWRYLGRTAQVGSDGVPCAPDAPTSQRLVAGTRLKVDVVYRCAAPPTTLRWRIETFLEDEGGHTVLGRFRSPAGYVQEAFDRGHPAHEVAVAAPVGVAAPAPPASTPPPATPDRAGVLAAFVREGVRHILGGPDHLAFVLALVVATRSWRRLGWTVTAFTVGHSLSLALSVLDVVRLPAAIVEPAIAASIVVVAVENLVRGEAPPHRAALALAFGVVHGFGFGSALRDLGVPTGGVVGPLVGFNLGVELGQLAVVVPVALALRALAGSAPAARRVEAAVSVVVAALGAAWLVDRVLGLGLLS